MRDGFLFETVQSIPFRTCCESLKEILVDCVFKFTPNGVSVVSMDNTKSIIVQLLLFKDNIERYYCDDEYYIAVNLNCFYKVIKTITTADAIAFKYTVKEPSKLTISIESIEKRSKNTYKMQLLQHEQEEELTFDVTGFDTVLQMQSLYFQKTCKDLLNTGGTYVELLTSNDCVIFKSDDNLLSSELSLYETAEGFRFKKKPATEETVSYGIFTLRHLVTFTKASTLCPIVTLYLQREMPLVLQYQVANLGIVRYCIASLDESEKKKTNI
tara:strand:+ start:784 stop:1593 length:810 start_codon:yes stop_codon:yes gene_type:complete